MRSRRRRLLSERLVPDTLLSLIFSVCNIYDYARLSCASRHFRSVALLRASSPITIDLSTLHGEQPFPPLAVRSSPQILEMRAPAPAYFATFTTQLPVLGRLLHTLTIREQCPRNSRYNYGPLSCCSALRTLTIEGSVGTYCYPRLPHLTKLCLTNTHISHSAFRGLATWFPALETLDVGGVWRQWREDGSSGCLSTSPDPPPAVFAHVSTLVYRDLRGSTLSLKRVAVFPVLTSLSLGTSLGFEAWHVFLIFLAGVLPENLRSLTLDAPAQQRLFVTPSSSASPTTTSTDSQLCPASLGMKPMAFVRAWETCSDIVRKLPPMPLLQTLRVSPLPISEKAAQHVLSMAPNVVLEVARWH